MDCPGLRCRQPGAGDAVSSYDFVSVQRGNIPTFAGFHLALEIAPNLVLNQNFLALENRLPHQRLHRLAVAADWLAG